MTALYPVARVWPVVDSHKPSFVDVFIRRPVLSIALSLIIILLGVGAILGMSIRQWPDVKSTQVTVSTNYPGAGASLVDNFVTVPLEKALGSVTGIDYMTASSAYGSSNITLNLDLNADLAMSMSDVSNKISQVAYRMPKDIQQPVVAHQESSQNAFYYLSFTSHKMTEQAVNEYLEEVVQPNLDNIPGVSSAKILGGRSYAMRLWLKPEQMLAYHVSPLDIQTALMQKNTQSSAGVIQSALSRYPLDLQSTLKTVGQFNKLIIRSDPNYQVKLGQVADVRLGSSFYDFEAISNFHPRTAAGVPSTTIAVAAQAGANTLSIAKRVDLKIQQMKRNFPKDLEAGVVWDTTAFIKASLMDVLLTLIFAIILVIVVMYCFLGSFRVLLTPILAIPISLLGSCAVIWCLGYSFNTLTLLALVLAVGMVVDDAIVVSENVFRHLEAGHNPFLAAILGAREIRFAVISMTITLVIVYVPIAFTGGLVGALFREFSFTLVWAIIVSGFVALTLSPMVCRYLLTNKVQASFMPRTLNYFFDKLSSGYRFFLRGVIKIRWIVMLLTIACYTGVVFLMLYTPQQLSPQEDTGGLMAMVTAPAYANINYTQKYTKQMEQIIRKLPGVASYLVLNGLQGPSTALAFVILKPWGDRKLTESKIINMLYQPFYMIPGVQAFPFNPFSLPGSSSSGLSFVLKTTGSYADLYQAAKKMKKLAQMNPGLANVHMDIKFDQPRIKVDVNRPMAADMGVGISDLGVALNLVLGSPITTWFTLNNHSYKVIPEIINNETYTNEPAIVNDVYLHGYKGNMVPMANLVHLRATVGPQSLNHFQQMRSVVISAALKQGYTQSEALNYMMKSYRKDLNTKVYSYDTAGATRQYVQSSNTLMKIAIFALILIYLVLAAQFESFLDPVIILLVAPLSSIGGMLFFKCIGGTMNLYTEISLLTLVGLISKHGILIVEFANQLQEQGKAKVEAVILAASIRLRPVLMTTLAMIFSALPLVCASGAGAVSLNQIGMTIIGGMIFGTLFSLIAVPAFYSVLGTKVNTSDAEEVLLDQDLSST